MYVYECVLRTWKRNSKTGFQGAAQEEVEEEHKILFKANAVNEEDSERDRRRRRRRRRRKLYSRLTQ